MLPQLSFTLLVNNHRAELERHLQSARQGRDLRPMRQRPPSFLRRLQTRPNR